MFDQMGMAMMPQPRPAQHFRLRRPVFVTRGSAGQLCCLTRRVDCHDVGGEGGGVLVGGEEAAEVRKGEVGGGKDFLQKAERKKRINE